MRAAAALCGTTHKTVKRVLERRATGQRPGRRRAPRPGLAEPFTDLIYRKVKATDGRITAKRLLPVARAEGYAGSARTFRRAVAAQKVLWRKHRRVCRPWVPEPGQHLLIDYGTVTAGPNTGLKLFTAVLAWSRWRFVRFCRDETLETTLRLLAECFEALGGVPIAGHDDVYRLITTILDPTTAPAEELARLYAQRWEFESTLDEIKTHLGGPQLVLRSQYPDGAEQELYGFLLVHHAIRTLMHRAAREGDHDPDRISFTRSLRVVRRQVTDQAAFSPQQTRPRSQNHAR